MFQLRIAAYRMDHCFTPQESQQRIALFGQTTQSLSPSTGIVTRNDSYITSQGLAVCESSWIAQKHVSRQGGDRSYSRMSHQQPCSGSSTSLLLDSLV